MLQSEFQTSYPTLYKMLHHISHDNDMPMKRDFGNVTSIPGTDLAELENKASKLTECEIEFISCGEYEIGLAVAEANDLMDLHRWLDECFDGFLTESIYA